MCCPPMIIWGKRAEAGDSESIVTFITPRSMINHTVKRRKKQCIQSYGKRIHVYLLVCVVHHRPVLLTALYGKKTSKVIGPAPPPKKKGHSQTRERLPYHLLPVTTSHVPWASTLDVWVRSELSVAKPFPQMLQWNGRFFMRSSCASWLRRCCCRFDSWMKARPQSGRWHL